MQPAMPFLALIALSTFSAAAGVAATTVPATAPIDLGFETGLDTSGFSFFEGAPPFDPSAMAAGFGALTPTRRVGWTPVPMRHG